MTWGLWAAQAGAQVPKIIFDSDMSSDWDDVGDIALLHGLASTGECEIIGMMGSSLNGATALCMDAINTWYGKPNIPIGRRPDVGGIGMYPGQIATEYPHGPETQPTDFPLAANLYRQLLAAAPNKSVIIATTGYLNNLQALMQSGPDQYSSLNGMDLIRQKVKVWACAGGAFPSGNEFNFRVESAAAYYVINNWPTAVTYTPFDVGQAIYTCGRLPEAPVNNPIRRVYVDIKGHYPYPSWGQIAMLQSVRGSNNLWGAENVGRNNSDTEGGNFWTSTPDPTGADDQAYLKEVVRTPVRAGIDALIMLPPNNGTPSKPGEPSDVRMTAVGGNRIDLQWTDNAYNESGFVIERRGANGTYSQIATVGANVKTYSDTGLSGLANSSYRVKATNAQGDSLYAYGWYYTGWTEINFAGTGTTPPIYSYYQHSNLRWARGGDFRPDHVALNNDSNHGQTLSIDVDAAAMGAQGSFFIYFFYQDQNNWYRLTFDGTNCYFQKKIGGVVTQIGASVAKQNLGNGSPQQAWRIEVTPAGNFKYLSGGATVLNVSEPLVLTTGLIGLGGVARAIVWENFRFATTGGGGTAPGAPTGLTATPGNGQASLSWTGSSGAISYEIYRATTSNGQGATPIASGVTGTSYTNTGLTNGTTYYYKVKAVNPSGVSGFSNEASAAPTGGGSAPAAPTGLAATAGNSQASLTWTASSGATSYEIYRSTSSNGQGTTPIATGVTSTSFTNTGLTNGTTYYYKVKAVNGSGTSGFSNEISATPTGGGGGGGSNAFLNGSFEIPAITGYTYTPTGSSWVFTNNAGIQRNGSAYSGTAAVAPDGVQTAFVQSSSGTLGTMSQSVTFTTGGSYTISFQAARRWSTIQPVRVSVDGVTVGTYTPASGNFEQITTASFTVSSGSHAIQFAATDSVGDKTSFIDLVSINSGGGSAPAAPGSLTATAGNTQITLNWSASSGATSYEIYRGTTANGQGATPIAAGVTGTTYSNTGLTNGTIYYYKIKAVNSSGASGFSNEASGTPTGGSAPSAPTGLTASAGNSQVILNWTASGGATSYNVYRGTSAGGQGVNPIATGITATTYTNTGLTNGTAYYFTVRAVSSAGTSGNSNEASATPSSGGGGSGAFVNASFESPSINGYTYSSTGTNWTFTNNAGIQRNGSAYSGSTSLAPDGVQTALLQSFNNTLGTMTQSVTLGAGSYTIGFKAARRWNTIQPIRITVDGTVIGTFTPSSDSYQQFTTNSFSVTAGSHTITFSATDSVGDKTSFIDQVSIQ